MIFKPRNARQVDAKLFTGSSESGQEIVEWVNARGGYASYFEGILERGIEPSLTLVGPLEVETVRPLSYVYFQIGDPDIFYSNDKEAFENEYVELGEI